jgi:hypothetical protein
VADSLTLERPVLQVISTSTANTHCRNRVTAERGYTIELFANKYTTALRGMQIDAKAVNTVVLISGLRYAVLLIRSIPNGIRQTMPFEPQSKVGL